MRESLLANVLAPSTAAHGSARLKKEMLKKVSVRQKEMDKEELVLEQRKIAEHALHGRRRLTDRANARSKPVGELSLPGQHAHWTVRSARTVTSDMHGCEGHHLPQCEVDCAIAC